MDGAQELWPVIAGAIIGFLLLLLTLYYLGKYLQGGQFKKDHLRMDDKVVIITGCNTGIGKEAALDLARRGATIYMACRDKVKCEDARQEIIRLTGNKRINSRSLDLASLDSVRRFVAEFKKEETRLDVLINNAGVMMCPKSQTKDGFEMQLGTNHLGHFLLTNLLLDVLKRSAPSRIITVSSLAHIGGVIYKDDINCEENYNEVMAYCQSKLANILFSRELTKRLSGTGVTSNTLHPGAVNTELLRYFPKFLRTISAPFLQFFFKTPKSGAQTHIYLAVDPEVETISGKYFRDCKMVGESMAAQNDEDALWLWNKSAEMVKLDTSEEKKSC